MRAVLHELRLLLVALGFLTRVPLPAWVGFRDEWLQASARHFPLVGALVGACGAAVLWGAASLWPLPVALLLSMAATLALTGAFHEDGLADTFDALGGPASRERALEIMKDSRLGTYGSVALVAVLALKFATQAELAPFGLNGAAAALLLAHGVSRAAAVIVMRALPYAGDADAAKAKPLARQVSSAGLGVALAWAVAIAVGVVVSGAFSALAVGVALASAAAVAGLMVRWLRRRLGGFTGDTLGATQQLAELAIYLVLAARGAA